MFKIRSDSYLTFTLETAVVVPASIPIITTVSNMNENSDYTFVMSLTSGLASGNVIKVVFPDAYVDELGISYLASGACTPTCSLSSRTVRFTTESDVAQYDSSNPTLNCIILSLNSSLNQWQLII